MLFKITIEFVCAGDGTFREKLVDAVGLSRRMLVKIQNLEVFARHELQPYSPASGRSQPAEEKRLSPRWQSVYPMQGKPPRSRRSFL
jgi:hypothetical protein